MTTTTKVTSPEEFAEKTRSEQTSLEWAIALVEARLAIGGFDTATVKTLSVDLHCYLTYRLTQVDMEQLCSLYEEAGWVAGYTYVPTQNDYRYVLRLTSFA